MRLWLPLFLHELLCQPSWQNGNFLTVLTPVRVWQGCDVNVSLADVPHETWHLHKFHLHHTDCKKRICTECIIDIYGGAFSVSYISSNSGSPLCSQHFRMNDLYRIVVNAGGKDSMNLKWIWIDVSGVLYFCMNYMFDKKWDRLAPSGAEYHDEFHELFL